MKTSDPWLKLRGIIHRLSGGQREGTQGLGVPSMARRLARASPRHLSPGPPVPHWSKFKSEQPRACSVRKLLLQTMTATLLQ